MNTPFKDRSAFREVFELYYNPLVNFIYSRYVKDYEISRDIVQSTFGKVWEKRDSINISTSIKSYLFQASRNRALDYIRSKTDHAIELQDDFRDYDLAEENVDIDARSFLIREQIVEAMKGMKPKMKKIFELNKFQGFSYEEIAADMEISKRTVESNMARAFAILRDKLKDSEIFN
ncbi:RNA polymerase sigma-70 factor [Portibacter marinus]|uniref:RNA polymerase sigma-70 factor n=1 Tax=Portibacter marinus TaxID=2898660 RepID=UPI001F39FA91|nr:RNA polymerase sigma-70 factor [Portibacter marinus]